MYETLHTQGYLDQLLYFAAHVRRVITPHTQCEQGKLIIVGVRVSECVYICVCVYHFLRSIEVGKGFVMPRYLRNQDLNIYFSHGQC